MELTPPPNQPVDIIDMPPKPKPVTDIYVSKTTGMKFVRVKGGTFKMGLPKKDDEYESAREHEVTLTKDFYMGVYEVTRGEFSKFVESTAHITEAERYGGLGWDAANKKFEFGKQFTWQNPGFEQTDDHPVVLVSWDDAVKFAEWLSRKDGRTYRLPTEAEWEYACRGRSTTRFHFGDAWEDLVMYANSADASYDRTTGENRGSKEDDGFAFTAPVGKFRPNKFGLYDMHGNVREWCSDWYRPYPRGRVIDPRGPETDKDRHRVIRGGSWAWEGGGCQSGYRDSGVTSFSQNSKGFRLVMEPPGR
jgi:formylglycine-generating enzyme required for sulfatase activity